MLEVFHKAEVTLNFHPNKPVLSKGGNYITVLKSILEDLQLKNLHQTYPEIYEEETDIESRNECEIDVFGSSVSRIDKSEKPKYGAVNYSKSQGAESCYGDSYFVLGKDLVPRMTTTYNDSSENLEVPAQTFENPLSVLLHNSQAIEAAGLENDDDSEETLYQEVQLWGPAPLNNQTVTKLYVDDHHKGTPTGDALANLVKAIGIPIIFYSSEKRKILTYL